MENANHLRIVSSQSRHWSFICCQKGGRKWTDADIRSLHNASYEIHRICRK